MAETTWDYSIQDFSPLFHYAGSNPNDARTLNLDAAWNQSCPGGGSMQLSGSTLCDIASVHTTNVAGATVSLTFFGQSIQLFGNVSAGMSYDVTVTSGIGSVGSDTSTTSGTPSGQLLASVSNLKPTISGTRIRLTAKPSSDNGRLSLEKAVITMGTGRTGANITRTVIQDDDASVQYIATPQSAWTTQLYDTRAWGIQHPSSNASWHQLSGDSPGSFSVPFSGNAILFHGYSSSNLTSTYRPVLDGKPMYTSFSNSSLPTGDPIFTYTDGLLFVQGNLSESSHVLSVDNTQGSGVLGLDYIEVISVTGGSPLQRSNTSSSSQVPGPSSSSSKSKLSSNRRSTGLIAGCVVGSILLLLVIIAAFLYWRRRSRPSYPRIDTFVTVSKDLETMSNDTERTQPTNPTRILNPYLKRAEEISTRRNVSDLSVNPNAVSTVPTPTPGASDPEAAVLVSQTDDARRSANGPPDRRPADNPSTEEMQAIRRDLLQLQQMVGRVDEHGAPPPEYE